MTKLVLVLVLVLLVLVLLDEAVGHGELDLRPQS
jgi:hypothetical protein